MTYLQKLKPFLTVTAQSLWPRLLFVVVCYTAAAWFFFNRPAPATPTPAAPIPEQAVAVRVTKVVDGDTINAVDADGAELKIRIAFIDAPERNQKHGLLATKHLDSMLFSGEQRIQNDVAVLRVDTDRYGRTVGYVLFKPAGAADWFSVGKGMVQNGWAVNRAEQYAKGQWAGVVTPYSRLQAEAKLAKRGVWADTDFVDPAEFRKAQR